MAVPEGFGGPDMYVDGLLPGAKVTWTRPPGFIETDTRVSTSGTTIHYGHTDAPPLTPPPGPSPVPPPNPTTPGISAPDVSNATYGKKIPISALGLARIGGNIICGPYISSDGSASFGVSFGFPADPTGTRQLREIAFDSKVAWKLDGGFTGESFTYRFYEGRQDQDADPIEVVNFPGEYVAYRPQMLLFFEDLPLAPFQNKIPYVAAVIGDTTDGDDPADGINIGTALGRIAMSPWTNYSSSTFEAVHVVDIVGGILLADDYSFVQLLKYISRIYRNLDILQSDKLRIKDHGAHVTPDIRLDLNRIISSDSPVQFQRQEPSATPRELELVTIDPDADYCWVSSKAQRPRHPVVVSASVGKETVTLPLIMNASTRITMVYFAQYAEEAARKKISFSALAYGYEIEPGDRVALIDIGEGIENEVFKVVKTMHGANYVVQCEAETIMRCSLELEDSVGGAVFVNGDACCFVRYLKMETTGSLPDWAGLGAFDFTADGTTWASSYAIVDGTPTFLLGGITNDTNSDGLILASNDGLSWSTVYTLLHTGLSTEASVFGIVWDEAANCFYAGAHFVNSGVHEDILLQSSDGFSWSEVSRVTIAGAYPIGLLAAHCSSLVTDTSGGLPDGVYGFDEVNGILIAPQGPPTIAYDTGIVNRFDGTQFVTIKTIEDGAVTDETNVDVGIVVNCVAYAGGIWMASGRPMSGFDLPATAYSIDDGLTWTEVAPGTNTEAFDILTMCAGPVT